MTTKFFPRRKENLIKERLLNINYFCLYVGMQDTNQNRKIIFNYPRKYK